MSDEDITFDSGGVTLAGSYRDVASPVAAALLISGSGRTDRNSDVKLVGPMRLREVLELIAGWVTRTWGRS